MKSWRLNKVKFKKKTSYGFCGWIFLLIQCVFKLALPQAAQVSLYCFLWKFWRISGVASQRGTWLRTYHWLTDESRGEREKSLAPSGNRTWDLSIRNQICYHWFTTTALGWILNFCAFCSNPEIWPAVRYQQDFPSCQYHLCIEDFAQALWKIPVLMKPILYMHGSL